MYFFNAVVSVGGRRSNISLGVILGTSKMQKKHLSSLESEIWYNRAI